MPETFHQMPFFAAVNLKVLIYPHASSFSSSTVSSASAVSSPLSNLNLGGFILQTPTDMSKVAHVAH